jgi:hypothetical protein
MLSVTAPICTWGGVISTVAGGNAGVGAAPLEPDPDATADGLATGLADSPGDAAGAPAAGAVTHPLVTIRTASGTLDQ